MANRKQPDKDARMVGAGVGGAIGGVAGALLGGPIGAAIGAALTSWIGHEVAADASQHGF